jgi:hypothetical protein
MKVICLRCGYDAGYLQRLKEHLGRKNVCPAIKRNMTPEEVYNYYASKINHKNTPPICEFCGKEYPEKNTAFRMHKSRCKKNFEETMKSEFSIPDEEPMTIEEKYKHSQEEIAKLKEELETLKKTNITYNDHSTNNSNIVVVVNSFGNEDLSHLNTPEFRKKLDSVMRHTTMCWDALPYFVQNIHYGKESNRNVVIKDPSDAYIFYFNGTEWVKVKKAEVFDKIMMEKWEKVPDFVSDTTRDHKYFKKVDDFIQSNKKYKNYLQGQLDVLFSNKGKINVFNNTGNETASVNKINDEFLLEQEDC